MNIAWLILLATLESNNDNDDNDNEHKMIDENNYQQMVTIRIEVLNWLKLHLF